jgi:hypothetical protein
VTMPVLGRLHLDQESLIADFYIDSEKLYLSCNSRIRTFKGVHGLDTMNNLKIVQVRGSGMEDLKAGIEKWAPAWDQSGKPDDEKNQEYFLKLSAFIKQYPKSKLSSYLVGNAQSLSFTQIRELNNLFDTALQNTYEVKNVKRLLKRLDRSANWAVGAPFHDAVLKDSGDREEDTRQFRGKYTLVVFWASWCGPCRAEHPDLNALYARYKARGFEMVGISLDEDRGKWIGAIEKDKL